MEEDHREYGGDDYDVVDDDDLMMPDGELDEAVNPPIKSSMRCFKMISKRIWSSPVMSRWPPKLLHLERAPDPGEHPHI